MDGGASFRLLYVAAVVCFMYNLYKKSLHSLDWVTHLTFEKQLLFYYTYTRSQMICRKVLILSRKTKNHLVNKYALERKCSG
jgi:hypothetical protein